ncbi:hypothetical protein [Rhodococcus sp. JS3073]|uniref:hypothetical protein n=1 Tax=Rhodococcus sp. JS3073 TaxID=3002901 RepID=UPI002286BA51|nr:hypothetical protein [Rhodococcus sp. JS3073]WAM19460.1 hypothetical protein OYT95_44200 [Rhodococcus sp. JS3073]
MNDANIAHVKGGAKAILQYGADVYTLDVDAAVDLLHKTRAIADDGGTGWLSFAREGVSYMLLVSPGTHVSFAFPTPALNDVPR